MDKYLIRFEFVPSDPQGDLVYRTISVQAENPIAAEKSAWRSRVTLFGLFGADNAIDCRAIPDD